MVSFSYNPFSCLCIFCSNHGLPPFFMVYPHALSQKHIHPDRPEPFKPIHLPVSTACKVILVVPPQTETTSVNPTQSESLQCGATSSRRREDVTLARWAITLLDYCFQSNYPTFVLYEAQYIAYTFIARVCMKAHGPLYVISRYLQINKSHSYSYHISYLYIVDRALGLL